MKNTFFILISGLLISISANAQKSKKAAPVKQLQVPENVSNTFQSLYSSAENNQWSKNYSGNYVASFTNAEHQKQTAEFSASGAVVKSRVDYPADALPGNLSTAVAAQYPSVKVAEASKLQMPGVAPYYKVKVIGSDNTTKELLVSEDGTISE
ncbi:MAG: hypothetical protein JST81_15675 [Bacteroidetes bacterium]|nr:hypothetical protein [Bacteroidota bacterium]